MKSIDELAFVGRGRSRHRPRNEPALYGGGYPFVQTADIHKADLYITTHSQTYSEKGLEQSKLWEAGTICISNAGENTGDCAILGIRACFPDSVIAVIAKETVSDPVFLKYALDQLKPQLRNVTRGATQDNLSVAKLVAFKFPTPPFEEQKQIGHILGTYGELIEINRRRMALLEESARLLYREWFVHLRFPGHECCRMTNGTPDGWAVHALESLCTIGRGASPRPIADFMNGEVPWFRIADATASESPYIFHTAEHVTDEGAKRSILLEPRSLILSNSATCGIPIFTAVPGCIHDGWLYFVKLTRISQHFLYCHLHFKRDELVNSVGDGSTQKNLNTAAVGRLKVLLPSEGPILNQFETSVAPVFEMILNLARQNIALRAARDLLVPRLMSGGVFI